MHRATIRAAGGIQGFRVSSHAPHGHGRGMVQDGPKKGPTPEVCPDVAPIVRRMFDMVEAGNGPLELIRTLNNEGIASPRGELWGRTSDHDNVIDEVCTGIPLWGISAKDNCRPGAGGEGISQLGGLPRHQRGRGLVLLPGDTRDALYRCLCKRPGSLFADTQEKSGPAVCARVAGPLQKQASSLKSTFWPSSGLRPIHQTVQRGIWALKGDMDA